MKTEVEIKANELMLGDWVFSKSISKPCKVIGIDPMEGLGSREGYTFKLAGPNNEILFVHASSVNPIPLTAEILEKNGWKKKSDYQWKYCDNSCTIKISISPKIEIEGELLGAPPINVKIEGALFELIKTDDWYIHELQHAFRLCRIDKEIEL